MSNIRRFAVVFMVIVMSMFAVSEVHATGLFSRFRRARSRVVVRQNVVVQRDVFVQPQRVVRIVEVPNLAVRRDVVVLRNSHGRVVDVRRQKVLEIQRVRPVRTRKVIIERNVIRGY